MFPWYDSLCINTGDIVAVSCSQYFWSVLDKIKTAFRLFFKEFVCLLKKLIFKIISLVDIQSYNLISLWDKVFHTHVLPFLFPMHPCLVSRQLSPKENCPPVRVVVWVKVRVSFRVERQPENCPRGKLLPG